MEYPQSDLVYGLSCRLLSEFILIFEESTGFGGYANCRL